MAKKMKKSLMEDKTMDKFYTIRKYSKIFTEGRKQYFFDVPKYMKILLDKGYSAEAITAKIELIIEDEEESVEESTEEQPEEVITEENPTEEEKSANEQIEEPTEEPTDSTPRPRGAKGGRRSKKQEAKLFEVKPEKQRPIAPFFDQTLF